ncbi:MAG: putative holin-like toxin [Lactobacillus sp.]|nr:putative holin-like toxin [Lactobacillus sp.]MCI2033028.1 putative holin-like toxin [Lactobacillus sp.]
MVTIADALTLMLMFGGFILTLIGLVVVRLRQSLAIKKTVSKLRGRGLTVSFAIN